MKRTAIFTLAMVLAMTTTACAQGISRTWIDGGRTFMLGGEQRSDFLLEARNIGQVPVTVLAEDNGVETVVGTVAPGQEVSHVFESGETALFRNDASSRAELRIVLTSEITGLSMRYDRP